MVNSEASTCEVIIQVRHCLQHTIGEHRRGGGGEGVGGGGLWDDRQWRR